MAAVLTEAEQAHLATLTLWLDSMRDWFALILRDEDPVLVLSPDVPPWVLVCAQRLDRSIFAQPNAVLAVPGLSPYAAGYALGLMRWGAFSFKARAPREVRAAIKKIRLSKKARRRFVRMWQDFLIDVQILVRKHGRLRSNFARELRALARITGRYSGHDESEFHRGLSAGLHGLGPDSPGDRSNDATEVYLLLVIWWRFVVRFDSVTVLHAWLTRTLGPARAGERKRTEKICQRIGLRFRERGRPRKNPTPALPA